MNDILPVPQGSLILLVCLLDLGVLVVIVRLSMRPLGSLEMLLKHNMDFPSLRMSSFCAKWFDFV